MSLADVVGSITGMLNTANELVIDVETVTKVRALLDEATKTLADAQSQMPAIPAASVGQSYWGSQLAHHSLLAHTHVQDTITQLNAGLDNYEQAMQVVLHNTFGADEDNAAMFKKGDAEVGHATAGHRGGGHR